jgi:Trk K+ transport system NAD-binding subunit
MASLPQPDDLSRRDRRIVVYFVGIVVLVLSLTVAYNYGMRVLEGRPQSLYRSLTAVVETMTTTGYGADAPWETPAMNLFMVFVQVTGIALGFVTLRLVIIPLFTRAEVDLDERLPPKRDHVVVCEYQRDPAVLLDELAENGVEYVLLSPRDDTPRALSDAGYDAIRGSTRDPDAYRRASLDTARAVLVDADEATVDTILTVRSLRPDVEVVALTDDSDLRPVLASVGADSVLSPYAVVGQRLGEKAAASFGATLGDAVGRGERGLRDGRGTGDGVELGADVEVVERLIPHDSPLVGQSLRESRLGERSGATVVGAWIDGQLRLPPDPDVELRPNTVLVVLGRSAAVDALAELTRPTRTRGAYDRVVVLGGGEVGLAAGAVLADADVDVVTVDAREGAAVDVVGDATTPETLHAAGVADAEAVVVCLPDDAAALLATALVRETNPDAEVLVRVNDTDATRKALSAGADYVLSVPRVSARMVVAELRGEEVVEPASQMRLARVGAAPFAGQTLAESGIYEATGCRVIAVEDGEGVVAPVPPDRTFGATDRLTVVGTDATVRAFLERFDISPAEG